ncbi:DoxX family protein [Polaribacter marinivivus]|uniref:DoxX family protein n=1 Tax=Polaribacter marinivivus TaxID=1524260 RepID=A0ABV8RAE7_9FLAO
MKKTKSRLISPLVQVARVIVGVLFIFSGAVKLVDPIGSQYKFEEYFSEGVLNIEFLIPYALKFVIILIILEVALGVALLVGYKSKFTLNSLKIIILFFLFLTWYSAYYNKVTDCGCFGDAIKLTPWQSFYKDVILMVLIFFLSRYNRYIKPIKETLLPGIIIFWAVLISGVIMYIALYHLPIIDFRAYKVGTNIPEGMKYQGDGKIPPIHDFMLEDEQSDLANDILKMDKAILVIASSIEKSEFDGFPEVKKFSLEAQRKGYKVYGVTASFSEIIELTQKNYNLPFKFLFCDETTLKTMIRANPGVIILNKGTIIEKKSWRDLDDIEL